MPIENKFSQIIGISHIYFLPWLEDLHFGKLTKRLWWKCTFLCTLCCVVSSARRGTLKQAELEQTCSVHQAPGDTPHPQIGTLALPDSVVGLPSHPPSVCGWPESLAGTRQHRGRSMRHILACTRLPVHPQAASHRLCPYLTPVPTSGKSSDCYGGGKTAPGWNRAALERPPGPTSCTHTSGVCRCVPISCPHPHPST